MVTALTGQVLSLVGLAVIGLLLNRAVKLELTLACLLCGFLAGLGLGYVDFDTGIRAHNLQELVFGGHPLATDPGRSPRVMTVQEDGERYLALEVRSRTEVGRVEMSLEFSPDLRGWQPEDGLIPVGEAREHGDGTVSAVFRSATPIGDSPRYLRWRLHLP